MSSTPPPAPVVQHITAAFMKLVHSALGAEAVKKLQEAANSGGGGEFPTPANGKDSETANLQTPPVSSAKTANPESLPKESQTNPESGIHAVPPELFAAMLQAQLEGHPQAVDDLAELGNDPEALSEFMADREAGTQGMASAKMLAAMSGRMRMFSAFAQGWEESKHKRGQPENKGQFGPGGGGKESKESKKDADKPASTPAATPPADVKAVGEQMARERNLTPGTTAGANFDHSAALTEIATDFPEAAKNPSLWAKVLSFADKVRDAIHGWLVRMTPNIMPIAEGILDTPGDLEKFGFMPTLSGLQRGGSVDALRDATGLGSHLAISVVSKVLSHGIVWAKHRMVRQPAQATPEVGSATGDVEAAAKWVTGALTDTAKATGMAAKIDGGAVLLAAKSHAAKPKAKWFAAEFDESKVKRDAIGEFAEKEGGGKAAESKPLRGRSKALKENAGKVKFTEDKLKGSEKIGSRDYDEIRDAMTRSERSEMQDRLNDIMSESIDESLRDANYDGPSRKEVAKGAGWDDSDVRDKAKELIDGIDDEDNLRAAAEKEIDEWYTDTRLVGDEAIEELADQLDKDDDYKELAKRVRAEADHVRIDIDEAEQSARDEWESGLRESYEQSYDSSYDEHEYLTDFRERNDDDPRFAGATEEKDIWGRDGDGDRIYSFETAGGSEYEISAVKQKSRAGIEGLDITFSDKNGSYGVTGSGAAQEVFSKVTTAIAGLVEKEHPQALSFSAAESPPKQREKPYTEEELARRKRSRQVLYDTLVRSVAKVQPDYSAVAVQQNGYRQYLIVQRDKMDSLREYLKGKADGSEVETLVMSANGSAGFRVLKPATEDEIREWHTAKWWREQTAEKPREFSAQWFSWFADPTPRSKSRVTDSETGRHEYGEAARRRLAWQGREDKGEPHPKTTKDVLVEHKQSQEPKREEARKAYQAALADPGAVKPEQLKGLAEHLHTLTRDEVRANLRQVDKAAGGKMKHDLVDSLLAHVRQGVDRAEAERNPFGMEGMYDLAGDQERLPPKKSRDQKAEHARPQANKATHGGRMEQRQASERAGIEVDKNAAANHPADKFPSVAMKEGMTPASVAKQKEETEAAAAKPISFETGEDADAWGKKNFEGWTKDLSRDEQKAIGRYRYSDYRPVNDTLRAAGGETSGAGFDSAVGNMKLPLALSPKGKSTPEEVKSAVHLMDSALAKATVPEDVTTYRGLYGEFAKTLKPGSEFTDHAYGSSSLSADQGDTFAAGSTMMKFVVPKGTHAAYITALDRDKGEQEMLLPRGAKYKITGEETDGGKMVLTAEFVPPEKASEEGMTPASVAAAKKESEKTNPATPAHPSEPAPKVMPSAAKETKKKPKLHAPNDGAPEDDGPKEGDRDANGLVFRKGRWRREGEEPSDRSPLHGEKSFPAGHAGKLEPVEGLSSADAKVQADSLDKLQKDYPKLRKQFLDPKAGNATYDDKGNLKSVTLNVDEWRHLFEGYTGTNALATHVAAGGANRALMGQMLEEQKGKGNGKFLVMAGGGGSGKGSAVGAFIDKTDYPIVLDQVSDRLDRLEQTLKKATDAGFKPVVTFIDRGAEDAWGGVVGRAAHAREKGELARTVPLEVAVKANLEARKATLALLEKAAEGVEVKLIDNTRGERDRKIIENRDEAIAYLKDRIAKEDAGDEGRLDRLKSDVLKRNASGEIADDITRGLVGHPETAHDLFSKIQQTGGFTYQPSLANAPKEGLSISTFPEAEQVFDAATMSEKDIEDYMMKNAEHFKDRSIHFGGWHDPDSGKVALDVVRLVSDPAEAESLARKYNQKGYYNLKTGETTVVTDRDMSKPATPEVPAAAKTPRRP